MNNFYDPFSPHFAPKRFDGKCCSERNSCSLRGSFPMTPSHKKGLCRLCHNDKVPDDFVVACACEGVTGILHVKCLEELIKEHGLNACGICGQKYHVEKTLRYTLYQSIIKWCCTLSARQDWRSANMDYFLSDFICYIFSIIFLVSFTHGCVIVISYFTQVEFCKFIPAVMSVHFLIIIAGFLYYWTYSWISSSLANQYSAWYFWWQHDVDIKILASPLTDNEIQARILSHTHARRIHRVSRRPRLSSIQSVADSDLEAVDQTHSIPENTSKDMSLIKQKIELP